MTQKKISAWIYGVLLIACVFALGYFAGSGAAQSEILVTVNTSQNAETPSVQMPETETAVESVQQPVGPVDLNSADQAALETLPGIGPELAQRIIVYRQTYGRFVSTQQLMDVEGIGEKRFAAIEQLITVEVADENSGSR